MVIKSLIFLHLFIYFGKGLTTKMIFHRFKIYINWQFFNTLNIPNNVKNKSLCQCLLSLSYLCASKVTL